MNFDVNMSKLQGAIKQLQNNGHLNQSGSVEAVSTLQQIFNNADKEARSRMCFFLILNTKLNILEELKNDLNVGLLVDICPNLEISFLLEVIFNLHLESCLGEFIVNCPYCASSEILAHFMNQIETPDFHKKQYSETYLKELSQAIFTKILIMQRNDVDKNGLSQMVNYYQKLIKLSETVIQTTALLNAETYGEFSSHQFLNFFEMMHYCLKLYIMSDFQYVKNQIYDIDISSEISGTDELVENADKKCVTILAETCENILKSLTLDMWMSWSDHHLGDPERSVQQMIGEIVYEICEISDNCSVFFSKDLKMCLLNLKIRPRTTDDLIKEANIDQIILKVSDVNSELRDKWFSALVHTPDIVNNIKGMQCVMNNLNLASDDNLRYIIEECVDFVQKSGKESHNSELGNLNRDTLFTILKMFPLDKQLPYLDKILVLNNPSLETANFDAELLESFNKLSNCDDQKENFHSLLVIFSMQSPWKTVRKICEEAIKHSSNDRYFDMLVVLKTACQLKTNDTGQNLLSLILKDLIDNEELSSKELKNLICLIKHLKFKTAFLDWFLFEKCIVDALRIETMNENWTKIMFCLETLQILVKFDIKEGESDKNIALLAFMSQILDHFSWDFSTFTTQKADARNMVISIVGLLQENAKALRKEIKEGWIAWLKKEVEKASIITQIYFNNIWHIFDKTSAAFSSDELHMQLLTLSKAEFKQEECINEMLQIFKSKKSFEVRSSVTVALIKILPILTSKEWSSVFDLLRIVLSSSPHHESRGNSEIDGHVFDVFVSALYVMSLMTNSNENHFPCFEFCVRNFGRLVLRNASFKSNSSAKLHLQILKGIVFFVREICIPCNRKSCAIILSPVILGAIERFKKSDVKIDNEEISSWMSLMNVEEVEIAVKNKLQDVSVNDTEMRT